jgi:hypothetical protein
LSGPGAGPKKVLPVSPVPTVTAGWMMRGSSPLAAGVRRAGRS